MAGAANQTRPATDLVKAAIAAGRPETLAMVSQVRKGEIHQVDLMRDLQFEGPEYLAMEA